MSRDIHLRGRLAEGRFGLVLQTGGGRWELDAPRSARQLIGREVEVTGQRNGFNELICQQVWLADTPRPRRLQLPLEGILLGGVMIFGLVVSLLELASRFL